MLEMKYSRQREALHRELSGRCDHPTADMLYQALRIQYPRVSLGTVYRNLSLLVNKGDICQILSEDGAVRYDADTRPHDHFQCLKCGKVMDFGIHDIVPCKILENENIASIKFHKLIFYGCCRECSKKAERQADNEKINNIIKKGDI